MSLQAFAVFYNTILIYLPTQVMDFGMKFNLRFKDELVNFEYTTSRRIATPGSRMIRWMSGLHSGMTVQIGKQEQLSFVEVQASCSFELLSWRSTTPSYITYDCFINCIWIS